GCRSIIHQDIQATTKLSGLDYHSFSVLGVGDISQYCQRFAPVVLDLLNKSVHAAPGASSAGRFLGQVWHPCCVAIRDDDCVTPGRQGSSNRLSHPVNFAASCNECCSCIHLAVPILVGPAAKPAGLNAEPPPSTGKTCPE